MAFVYGLLVGIAISVIACLVWFQTRKLAPAKREIDPKIQPRRLDLGEDLIC